MPENHEIEKRNIQTIAITAGKGGVGKTNISANLAIALANLNKRVMLFDADLGLANIDVLLGLTPSKNLFHVLNGDCSLSDIILDGPRGIRILPSASGAKSMAKLTSSEQVGIINAFSELSKDVDILIVDTATGISDTVINFTSATQEILVILCNEPASIIDAHALIKIMNKEHQVKHFRILTNMTSNMNEGRELYFKLCKAIDDSLDVSLDYVGSIPYDESLKEAVQQQKAVTDVYPDSKSAKEFEHIANEIITWKENTGTHGNIKFFIERLLKG